MLSVEIEDKYVAKTYSNISNQFDQTRNKIWSTTRDQILSLLKNYSNKKLKVLELGCGNGRNLEALIGIVKHNDFFNIDVEYENICTVAIEPCYELYQILFQKGFDIVINCGHFSSQLDCLKNTQDIVLSIAVIHHLTNAERRRSAIKELISLASCGGYIIIQVMALHLERETRGWEFLDNNDFLIPWVRTGDMRYYHLFEKGELEGLLEGLDQIELVHSFEDRANYGVVLRRIY